MLFVVQALKVGNTLSQPAMSGLLIHEASVGGGAVVVVVEEFLFGNKSAPAVTVPPLVSIMSPAVRVITPLVEITDPPLSTMSLSAVLPVEPAVKLMLPLFV